jgi:large subunit ribosomal protein L35
MGMPWRPSKLNPGRACRGSREIPRRIAAFSEKTPPRRPKGISKHSETSKMPKMKTKSGAKKRFKVTANGHIKSAQAGKRHGMIKRTTKFIRKARGTTVLSKPDEIIIKKNFLPYA